MPQSACAHDLWQEATRQGTGQVAALMDAFQDAAARDPAVELGCHEEAHLAGRALERSSAGTSEAVRALLAEATRSHDVCDNGVMHGVMDSYTHRPGHRKEVLVEHCETLRAAARDACAHGLGHSAWQATHDIPQALRWCLAASSQADQNTCAMGVSMQMYRPETDGSRPADLRPEGVTVDLPRVCAEFLQAGATEGMYRSCFTVAAGEMAGIAMKPTRDWLNDRSSQSRLRTAGAAWQEALTGCGQLPSVAAQGCSDILVRLLAGNLMGHEGAQATLCAQLPGAYAARCARQEASIG